MEDPVVTALRAAYEGNPAPEVALSLGDRLTALGRHAEALEALERVLVSDPAHIEALSKAANAADAAGYDQRAAGYRRLHTALTGAAAPTSAPARQQVTTSGDSGLLAFPGAEVIQLVPDADPNRVSFADVGGLDHVKKRIDMQFLAPVRNPQLFNAYGKSIKGGLLLYGPPGCGKTHIARATAGEVGARFTSIGLIDVLDMWIGESEKHLHELFENARRQSPTVIFLDELDAIGQKRSQMRHSGARNLVNQLLIELDGIDTNDGVYVVAATNHPWDVDPALKRPGRFDRTVLVTPPDRPGRAYILERTMRDRPAEGLDYTVLAANTMGFSGADIVHLCDSAVDAALEAAMKTGDMKPVVMGHFAEALKEVKPSIGPWLETAKNYALYANEGGMYDDLAQWLKEHGR